MAKPRKRIWVQQVAVETSQLKTRVDAARARGGLSASQEVVAEGIDNFLNRASDAAFRDDPIPGRWANWWRGTLVEAAFRNLHAAKAQMVDLLDKDELRAEIPNAVARANATLHRDDPRLVTVSDFAAESVDGLRPRMRGIVADSFERVDQEHAQLRNFRNILFIAVFLLIILISGTLFVVSKHPSWMPMCFPNEVTSEAGTSVVQGQNCPTASATTSGPQGSDILIVATLGALGGTLAATLSIRNLKGTSTVYDVPVALAILKVPLGALTAILALVAIQGDFVPGLSVLDSQGQILAYALVFGFSQQAFTRLLDQRAQTLLEGLPGGTGAEPTRPGADTLAKPNDVETVGGAPTAPQATTTTAVTTTSPPNAAVPGPGDAGLTVNGSGDMAAPATGVSAVPGQQVVPERPVDEPPTASQQDQLALLRETGNDRREMSEEEEGQLLAAEFGPPNAQGIYGAPPPDGGQQ